jgi:hypothetical protein
MSARHVGDILLCQPFFGCQCCVGESYPQHTFLPVGMNWHYTFLGMYHVSHACRNQIFCCKEYFVRSTQHKKLLSRLGAFHAFARSTQHKKLLSCLGAFYVLAFITPRGVIGFIVLGTFIKKMILTPFKSRSVSDYIYLCLLGGKTLQFSTSRPGIRTLACCLRALGFLVNVYPFLTNTFKSTHPNVRRYIVVIADTLLVIIPPAAVAREYKSIWYADSFSMSDSSRDSLHLNPTS